MSKKIHKESISLSKGVKTVIIILIVISGIGFTFGMTTLTLLMNEKPVTNNNDTYNDYNTYNNYTTINNNGTSKQTINVSLFEIFNIPQYGYGYFFNLSLSQRTTIDFLMMRYYGSGSVGLVIIGYNISIMNYSSKVKARLFFRDNLPIDEWFFQSDMSQPIEIILPLTLLIGSDYLCQFWVYHNALTLKNFQIILGYTIYL